MEMANNIRLSVVAQDSIDSCWAKATCGRQVKSLMRCMAIVILILSGCLVADRSAVADPKEVELELVQCLQSRDLHGINRMVISKDGKFLYAAAWMAGRLSVYARSEDGKLALVKHVEIPKLLEGVIKLKLNRDESKLVAICLSSSTLLLFRRDATSGLLQPDGFSRDNLGWATCCEFSPDSQQVYVGDSGSTAAGPGAPSSFSVMQITKTGGLRSIQRLQDECLSGVRDIYFEPRGESGYLACLKSDSIVVLDRNPNDGSVKIRQVLQHGKNGIGGLDGVCSLVMNRAGTRLFTVSGRRDGVNAVCVFAREEDGSLTLERELVGVPNFNGGNHIAVTEDEGTIFITGSETSSLAVITNDKDLGVWKIQRVLQNSNNLNIAGASGLTLSPDQKFLYVAAELGDAITTFRLIRK